MILDFFYQLIESLVLVVNKMGYFGIFFGMTIESSFIPFPSELILVPAGALAALGEMNFLLIILAGILGSILGALINYYIALFLGRNTVDFLIENYGKMFLLTKKNLQKSDLFFQKHGEITTFIGRLIPVIRQLISLPAGFSKMNLPKFIFFTSLGAGIWAIILTYIGYVFGNNLLWIHSNKDLLTLSILAFSLIVVLIYLIYYKNKKRN
jgi:membrane protein DedA with SNARE-associated domain